MKTVTKTTALRYILYFYTPGRVLGVVEVLVTHAQYLHQMAVNGQFHVLASVPWERRHCAFRVGGFIWARAKCVVVIRLETQTFQNLEEILYYLS